MTASKTYATVEDIRREAGFENATNLKDSAIAEQLRQAQSEINAALSGVYAVPFDPVPEIIRTLTVQLTAAFLLITAYGTTTSNKQKLADARKLLDEFKNRESEITDENGTPLSSSDTVTGFPEAPSPEYPRYFHMRDKF